MRMFGFMRAASVAALLTFDSGATLAQGTDLVTVTVVGSGANEAEARLDAIRQATQQVATQIVMAQRQIVDEQIVRDTIETTMRGYVQGFKEISRQNLGESFQITAEIAISRALMERRGKVDLSKIAIDGESIFAEIQREAENARISSEGFNNIFSRFPYDALSVTSMSYKMQGEDLLLSGNIGWNESFLLAIEEYLAAVSYASCDMSRKNFPPRVTPQTIAGQPIRFTPGLSFFEQNVFGARDAAIYWAIATGKSCNFKGQDRKRIMEIFKRQMKVSQHPALDGYRRLNQTNIICVGDNCYLLPAGNYFEMLSGASRSQRQGLEKCKSVAGSTNNPLSRSFDEVEINFLPTSSNLGVTTSTGRPVRRTVKLEKMISGLLGQDDIFMIEEKNNRTPVVLKLENVEFSLSLASDSLDFSTTTDMMAFATMGGFRYLWDFEYGKQCVTAGSEIKAHLDNIKMKID